MTLIVVLRRAAPLGVEIIFINRCLWEKLMVVLVGFILDIVACLCKGYDNRVDEMDLKRKPLKHKKRCATGPQRRSTEEHEMAERTQKRQ